MIDYAYLTQKNALKNHKRAIYVSFCDFLRGASRTFSSILAIVIIFFVLGRNSSKFDSDYIVVALFLF